MSSTKRKRDDSLESSTSTFDRESIADVISEPSVARVPVEILLNVAKYLHVTDLYAFSASCRQFYYAGKSVLEEEILFHKHCAWTRYLRPEAKHLPLTKLVQVRTEL
eukprot:TRINITY_DN33742_c0_g1_i1.p2 TRINITY_DN33742_c0_g1~~TRINITY_DN33742_c0_g1_i1.p2  ORF type:complete len:107 (+),score=9.34 TRINITY_DN33742_c0_g1_i1:28-348(+)